MNRNINAIQAVIEKAKSVFLTLLALMRTVTITSHPVVFP